MLKSIFVVGLYVIAVLLLATLLQIQPRGHFGYGYVSQAAAQVVAQPETTAQQQRQNNTTKNNDSSLFLQIGGFADRNHDAIEALSAVAAVIVAFGLAVVTGLLWWATRNLAISTAGLRDAAREQSGELRAASALAAKQFDLAEKQFLLEDEQVKLAAKQHGLHRLQYIAEHRPIIEIRRIGLAASGSGGLMFQPGFTIKGSLVIVNTGASDATIRETEYRFFMSLDDLPITPPLVAGSTTPLLADLPHTMAGHESCAVEIESAALAPFQAQDFRTNGACKLYIMGAILYSDWDLKDRWMGFCRKYVSGNTINGEGRFVPVDNPDYEYSD